MFFAIQLLGTWIAWRFGIFTAQYFEACRPKKITALLISIPLGLAISAIILTARYYGATYFLKDSLFNVEFFGPFDLPFLFLYCFFVYGGAISFYPKSRK